MASINRKQWLTEVRENTIHRFDTLHSLDYDSKWGEIGPLHRKFVTELVQSCPVGSTVLDAACGTGKYWGLILGEQRQIFGVDQSKGMLSVAQKKYSNVKTELAGLQELNRRQQFPGVICVDAMECVPPEAWPLVLLNLKTALLPTGHLYLTVELTSAMDVDKAYENGVAKGLPIVHGEVVGEGYHYYPTESQVREWLEQAGLKVLREAFQPEYWHLLCERKL